MKRYRDGAAARKLVGAYCRHAEAARHRVRLEFVGNRGVALVSESYPLIEGPDCYLRLLNQVYHTLRNKADAEVLSICTDETLFQE